jgi:hypothetical protein
MIRARTPPPHNWIPGYSPALSQGARLYYVGARGTVYIATGWTRKRTLRPARFLSQRHNLHTHYRRRQRNFYFGFDVVGWNPASLTPSRVKT